MRRSATLHNDLKYGLCALLIVVLGSIFAEPFANAVAPAPEATPTPTPAPTVEVVMAKPSPEPLEAPQETETVIDEYEYIPLEKPLREALTSECFRYGIPVEIALGLIDVESDFQVDALNPKSGCYGLMQLHPRWFPSDLEPADNIAAGLEYLASQLQRYEGDMEAALTAYNAGFDTGKRDYANAVLAAAEEWRVE